MSSKSRGGRGRRKSKALQQKEQQGGAGRVERRLEIVSASYEGPIPPAGMLQQYEAALPGTADWILTQAAAQGKHRRKLESRIVNRGTFAELLAAFSAPLIALAMLGAGTWLIYTDHDVSGLSIIAADVIAFYRIFKSGQRRASE